MCIRMLQYNLNHTCGRLSSSKKKKKNLFVKIKIQNFEFEAQHTNIFNINRIFWLKHIAGSH